MSDVQNVLYLIVKRPDPNYKHRWRGPHLLEMHTSQKAISMIEKYQSERLFVKISGRRDILCSVMVEDILKNEDGTFTVKFKDIRTDHWVLPGQVKRSVGGVVEGPPPIPVPMN